MFTIIDKLKAWTHKGIGNWRYMTIVFKTHMVFDANTWVCLITGTAILNGASLVHRWKILASRPVSAREKLQRLEIFSKIALIWSRMLKNKIHLLFASLGIRGYRGSFPLRVHAGSWTVTHLSTYQGRHWPRHYSNHK